MQNKDLSPTVYWCPNGVNSPITDEVTTTTAKITTTAEITTPMATTTTKVILTTSTATPQTTTTTVLSTEAETKLPQTELPVTVFPSGTPEIQDETTTPITGPATSTGDSDLW